MCVGGRCAKGLLSRQTTTSKNANARRMIKYVKPNKTKPSRKTPNPRGKTRRSKIHGQRRHSPLDTQRLKIHPERLRNNQRTKIPRQPLRKRRVVQTMTCTNNKCEYSPLAPQRQLTRKRSAKQIRYAQLWAEIELPKLLGHKPEREPL